MTSHGVHLTLLSLLILKEIELEMSSPMIPATSDQFKSLFEYLESYRGSNKKKPTLLHIGCGDGRVCIAASPLCSQTIGVDKSALRVHTAIKLAFHEGVLDTSNFFHSADLFDDPRFLLGSSTLLAEKIWEADVVFLHSFPSVLKRLVPLLAKLSDVNYEHMRK